MVMVMFDVHDDVEEEEECDIWAVGNQLEDDGVSVSGVVDDNDHDNKKDEEEECDISALGSGEQYDGVVVDDDADDQHHHRRQDEEECDIWAVGSGEEMEYRLPMVTVAYTPLAG